MVEKETKEEKKKEEVKEEEPYTIGEIATKTEEVIVETKTGNAYKTNVAIAMILNKLDKLMKLLD